MAKDYDYPTYDAGGRVERYAEGGKVKRERIPKTSKGKPKHVKKKPDYVGGPYKPPIGGEKYVGGPYKPPIGGEKYKPLKKKKKKYAEGGKVNKEVVKELRGKYHTDDSGITHLGKPKKGETPWEAHLRHSKGKSKYFKNEKEYNEFRKDIKK